MDEQLLNKRSSEINASFVTIESAGLDQHDEPDPQRMEELRSLFKLVLPVTGTTIFEFLPGFVSILLAGNMDVPDTQHYVDAATISVMLLNVTALSLGLGLASALDTLCSQAYGAKKLESIGIYFQTGILSLSAALVPIVVINSFAEPILNALGQHAEITHLSRDFSRLMLPGLPFLFLYELVRKVMQTQNVVKPLVIIAVVGNIVNLAAGYVLAYHTSLGFNGIAVGRSLGNMTLPLLLVPYFWLRPEQLRQWWCNGWNLKEAFSHMGLFWRIGSSGMIMMSVEVWAFEILSIMAGVLPNSVVALATHSVLMNVNVMLWTVFYGIAVAASIRVGNCLGANQPKKAKMACNLALAMTFGLSLVFMALVFGLSDHIPKLFLSDQESIDLASKIMAAWSPLEIADGLNAVMQGVFRGAGKQKPAAIANVVGYYGGGISLAAILAFALDQGVEGLWFGIGFGIVATLAAMAFMMLRYWKWDQLAADALKRTEH
ncbi:hypothetical protein PR003_g17535 [Phytophthora rubi]|uniref:Multidrug and toxin extrusion protein 1 n=1 Tax=Phytophthora rubi TaxID=129364 RepID=A0A6A3J6H8_9STRA|nr:hypothetical protein PR002_g21469 [Phytophthora rubi]KAE8991706.1 hypothetical protein PR001_g21150 [Phytophthora rubi]KAE9321191.1 hypothetical protein PR003_g17535 [Phytophthora rubi]